MHEAQELNRLTYLQAMGLDCYVSRHALPAAAPSQKLALASVATQLREAPRPEVNSAPSVLKNLQRGDERRQQVAEPEVQPQSPAQNVAAFSIASVHVGNWLWLEDITGMPLAKEQVQLIGAMARALELEVTQPRVTQFDWPLHNNQQLDLGPDAAASSLAGFVQRQLSEVATRGLVTLGDSCRQRLPLSLNESLNESLDVPLFIHCSVPTRQMLAQPGSKKQAWEEMSAQLKSG